MIATQEVRSVVVHKSDSAQVQSSNVSQSRRHHLVVYVECGTQRGSYFEVHVLYYAINI